MTYSVEYLKNMGAIYLDHIQEGFDYYDYQIVSMSVQESKEMITNLCKRNGWEHSFADFYYYQLEEEAKSRVDAILEESEITYLNDKQRSLGDIIFSLDEEFIQILVKLNDAECLFSSFYFTKEPFTLWGNYNQQYVIFKNRLDK